MPEQILSTEQLDKKRPETIVMVRAGSENSATAANGLQKKARRIAKQKALLAKKAGTIPGAPRKNKLAKPGKGKQGFPLVAPGMKGNVPKAGGKREVPVGKMAQFDPAIKLVEKFYQQDIPDCAPTTLGKAFSVIWFVVFFMTPTFVAGWYYFSIATPMYVSEMSFALKSGEGQLVSEGDLLSNIFSTSGVLTQDLKVVRTYIHSPEMLNAVNTVVSLPENYSIREADWYSRLTSKATQNTLLSYWKWITTTQVDTEASLLQVSVKAFTPEKAQQIAMEVLNQCELFVNSLNDRSHSDAVRKAEDELVRAEERVRAASLAMESFRRQYDILDLQSTATMRMGIVSNLEIELAKVRAELASKKPFMAANSSEIKMLAAKEVALDKQLKDEQARITGSMQGNSLTTVATQYESMVTELEFARKQHEAALTAMETTRVRAETKSTYVVPVSHPTLADESLYPKRLLFFLAFMGINLCVYILLSLIGSALWEHAQY